MSANRSRRWNSAGDFSASGGPATALWGKPANHQRSLQGRPGPSRDRLGCFGGLGFRGPLVRPEELDASWPEGHVYKAGDGKIVLAGKMGWDTFFGVVTFLESLGARFLGAIFPGSQIRPLTPARLPPKATKVVKPAFVFRPGWNQLWRLKTREHGYWHPGGQS